MKYETALELAEANIETYVSNKKWNCKKTNIGKHGEEIYTPADKNTKEIAKAVLLYLEKHRPDIYSKLKLNNINTPDIRTMGYGNSINGDVIVTTDDGKITYKILAKQYEPYL